MQKVTQLSILIFNLKNSIFATIGVIIAFVAPINGIILAVGCSIFFDTILGLWRSLKIGEKITSRKMSRMISKMLLYQFTLLLFFIIEKYILQDFIGYFINIPLFLSKLVSMTLIFIELTSINENFFAITGMSLWNKFKTMLQRTKELKEDYDLINPKKKDDII